VVLRNMADKTQCDLPVDTVVETLEKVMNNYE
jgi:hypothetical protein